MKNRARKFEHGLVRRKGRSVRGLTLIEMLVSITIGLMALFMIYNFLGSTRMHYMYGTVNLQNLQDARLAINYLRRDFSSSCFFVSPSDAFKTVQLARMSGFKSGTQWSGGSSHLIEITNRKLSFHRFDFGIDQAVGTPTVKLVEYEFDPGSKTLNRLDSGQVKTFKGFENVEFKLYVHDCNSQVPMLWVKIVVNESGNIYGDNLKADRALELTTTISSAFVTSNLENLSWNYETAHQ